MFSTKHYDIRGLSSNQTIYTSVHAQVREVVGRWTDRQADREAQVGKQIDSEEES